MFAEVDAATLSAWLVDDDELALLDAREQGAYFHSHLFHAACVPLSQLELVLDQLVPRRDVRIVWCDDGSGLAERAAAKATEQGWTNNHVLMGGTAAWSNAGGELYAGINVPSKAFGEYVEHAFDTPRIPAAELNALLEAGENLVVLDSRPMPEYHNMSIPTGIDCPGAELVYRVKEVVDDPATTVVVNCAGRTRSIIGAQSLINAGLPNRVVALENGTMGWELAGLTVERGQTMHAPDPSSAVNAWSTEAARMVGERFGVRSVSIDELEQWRADPTRSTYLLDVRTPEEFEAGHLEGSISAPGGQLVQATDEYVATMRARLVLIDDNRVRATMTASWLRQLGWNDAVVLDVDVTSAHALPTSAGRTPRPAVPTVPTTTVSDLAKRFDQNIPPVVLDLGSSAKFRRRGHIPGAWWGVRSRLAEARAALGEVGDLVLTSSDGQVAKLAVPEAQALWPEATITALAGGNKSWRHADHLMSVEDAEEHLTTTTDDVWYKPYDHDEQVVAQHMRDYLTWEIALVDKIRRDPTVTFPVFE